MSKFLGPIHYILYERICFLSAWNEVYCHALNKKQNFPFHTIPLENHIDEGNIHESLQGMILYVQQEHGSLVQEFVEQFGRDKILDVLEPFAKTNIMDGNIQDIVKQYQARFLHGMPCDRNLVIEMLEDNHAHIYLHYDSQVPYFRDASLWIWEREQLINKMLPEMFVYEEKEDGGHLYQKSINQTWRDMLEEEHEIIRKVLQAMKKQTIQILHQKYIDKKWISTCLDYLSEYADTFHHQKEEELLFDKLKEASPQGKVLVENGMLIEHEMARYYIKSLKKLLNEEVNDDICVRFIGYMQAYIDLLERHIDKENGVAYPYAQRVLDQESIQKEFDETSSYPKLEALLSFIKASE